ncbi:hypothetical protein HDV06_004196 [Boothiomyces sp. JEL0866]|nr:hypothetical protein HDV06_004196 [Boothiomyces sp. JEL0866]
MSLSEQNTVVLLEEEEKQYKIPELSLWEVFKLFHWFGWNSWGGAVPQIVLLKDELVIKQKWISVQKFNRVYAVYQVLPGPEAAELCCYFGYLARGRLGGIIAGVAFLIPGLLLILLFSWIYSLFGNTNKYFNATFRALQPLVAAMFIKAVHKIGVDAIYDHETKELNILLFALSILSALNSALRINLFITLGVFGLVYAIHAKGFKYISYGLIIIQYLVYGLLVGFFGFPSENSLSVGVAPSPTMWSILLLGIVSGALSFGGAYTTIPFILQEAVIRGGWISQQTFLDGVALANALPAPTVIFSTFVGFIGGKIYSGGDASGSGGDVGYGILGGVLMTIGMFFAPFSFAVIGHPVLDKITHTKWIASFFDGITASVVGVIAATSLDITRGALTAPLHTNSNLSSTSAALDSVNVNSLSTFILGMTLYVMYNYKFKNQSLILVICTAIGGQFLFK